MRRKYWLSILFGFSLLTVIFLFLWGEHPQLCSREAPNEETKIRLYTEKYSNPEEKLKQFQEDFHDALTKPDCMAWIGHVYMYGFMNHIGYTELGPGFVAFVDLHQALYRAIHGMDSQFTSVPPSMKLLFSKASQHFLCGVSKLKLLKNIEDYEIELYALYHDFLFQFMQKHRHYFEVRWGATLENVQGREGYALDVINRAFCALTKEWPTYEGDNNPKYQFERLHAYRCDDGRILILGYNDRLEVCDRYLHVYIWDEKNVSLAKLGPPNTDFDLSPVPRYGGCGELVRMEDVVHFNGRYLKFSGYNGTVLRHYSYDVRTNEWEIKKDSR